MFTRNAQLVRSALQELFFGPNSKLVRPALQNLDINFNQVMTGNSTWSAGEILLGDPGKIIIPGDNVKFYQGNSSSTSDASGAGDDD